MSKFNSVEISTQSSQKCERKNILNLKIIKKCYSFWGFKAGTEHWPIFAHFGTKTLLCYVGKILEFFSKLPNPGSTSGETIQNLLNY